MKPSKSVILRDGPDDPKPLEIPLKRDIYAKLLRIARKSKASVEAVTVYLIAKARVDNSRGRPTLRA